jgi:anhydro-N-acetylmuramic acid kinase
MKMPWHIGLMTGTVLDGNIDVAFLRTDGKIIGEFGYYNLMPYDKEVKELLVKTLDEAQIWNFNGPEPEIFSRTEAALTNSQTAAVQKCIKLSEIDENEIGAVGFHGQTVLHRAPRGSLKGATRQLGDGQEMANQLGIPVVYDFRSNDMKEGGQGAPLCPIYHAALLEKIGATSNTAILNLGGLGNLSFSSEEFGLIAFDTGPANAPLNDWIKLSNIGEMDINGDIAAKGKVNESKLSEVLSDPYFEMSFPKSLDRFGFSHRIAQGMSIEDGAATLTALAAAAVAKGIDLLPVRPTQLIVSGGGRKNFTMMREISIRANIKVETADKYNWRGDAIEAECFAFLAARTLANLPISYPKTTGVAEPMVGGVIAHKIFKP